MKYKEYTNFVLAVLYNPVNCNTIDKISLAFFLFDILSYTYSFQEAINSKITKNDDFKKDFKRF